MIARKTAIFLSACMLACAGTPFYIVASAGYAPAYWEGVRTNGAIVRGEDSPVVLEKQAFTFSANTFPVIGGTQETAAYDASMAAEYTFFNSADYAVNMKLVFPFREAPDYETHWDEEDDPLDHARLYSITADGEAVASAVRHTYSTYAFDAQQDAARLQDEKKDDVFFKRQTPVTVYEMEIRNISVPQFYLSGKFTCDEADTRVIVSDFNSWSREEDGERIGAWYYRNGNKSFTVTVIGVQENVLPVFSLYEDYTREKPLAGNVAIASQTSMSFEDYALRSRKQDSEVSEIDWYNAAIDSLNGYGKDCAVISSQEASFTNRLARWLEYQLEFPANGKIVNRVTAPLYPSVNGGYSPYVYRYECLLSSAAKRLSFSELEIAIDTPYFLTECSLQGFQKTENGYVLKQQEFPQGVLMFSLCETEQPVLLSLPNQGGIPVPIAILIGAGVALVVVPAGICIYIAAHNARKNAPNAGANGEIRSKRNKKR